MKLIRACNFLRGYRHAVAGVKIPARLPMGFRSAYLDGHEAGRIALSAALREAIIAALDAEAPT